MNSKGAWQVVHMDTLDSAASSTIMRTNIKGLIVVDTGMEVHHTLLTVALLL